VLLDEALRPWLVEVNHSPSFTTDTPLDLAIKERVITEAVKLVSGCVGGQPGRSGWVGGWVGGVKLGGAWAGGRSGRCNALACLAGWLGGGRADGRVGPNSDVQGLGAGERQKESEEVWESILGANGQTGHRG
jgi:hypothetical protein